MKNPVSQSLLLHFSCEGYIFFTDHGLLRSLTHVTCRFTGLCSAWMPLSNKFSIFLLLFHSKYYTFVIDKFKVRMSQSVTMSVLDYEKLFKQYYERLYYHAHAIVHDENMAKDVVSEVFINVWRLRESIDVNTVLSYLYTSVRNRCLDQLKQSNRQVPLLDEVLNDLENYTETDWNEYETRIALLKAELNRQPERVRRVLYLRFYEQNSNQEVADVLGISVDGVKKIIQRSFAQMRVSLSKKMLKFVPLLLLSCIN